jgi:hypothetical protein
VNNALNRTPATNPLTVYSGGDLGNGDTDGRNVPNVRSLPDQNDTKTKP